MNFVQRFTFLFSAPTFEAEDLEGLRVAEIIAAIQRMGFQVIRAPRIEDAEIAVQTDAAIGCLVVDWGKKGLEGKAASLINVMRRRGLEMPIVLLVRRKRFEDVPVEVLDFIDGYVFLAEETPEFIARNLVSRLTQYAETLKTPFFGALVDYAEQGNQLWTCPGHNGGIFYSRSPIGRIFMEHLGEAIFRDDSTTRSPSSATCLPTKARHLPRKRRRPRFSAPKRLILCSTARRPPTRSRCRR
jgi:ornithine decarboxylase